MEHSRPSDCWGLYLQRGDTVLIEDPTYFGAVDAFRAVGGRLSSLPVGKEGVSPTILRERISSTAARLVYLTPTLQNPTGSVMPVLAGGSAATWSSDNAGKYSVRGGDT